jgi:hypothetical protein
MESFDIGKTVRSRPGNANKDCGILYFSSRNARKVGRKRAGQLWQIWDAWRDRRPG